MPVGVLAKDELPLGVNVYVCVCGGPGSIPAACPVILGQALEPLQP